ncbi:MAG: hypothetical protein E6Q97_33345 [Desulfurellales bacterium]|nr:MAG: hypothetical protein E6Q97_33345 [Desulfurellales bacterium]
MNYSEIFDEVKMLSKRQDVDDKIATCIRLAAMRAHRLMYFPRDRVEVQLSWGSQATLVDVNILTWLPRYRAVDYMRYWEPTTGVLGNELTFVDPRDVMDEYNYEKTNRWYQAGDVLKLKFTYPSYGVQIGYYCDPILTPTTAFTSWIADKFPDIIVQGALAYLFNMTGKQEEARALNAMVGFETNPGANINKGPTLVEQLKQYALEEQAR